MVIALELGYDIGKLNFFDPETLRKFSKLGRMPRADTVQFSPGNTTETLRSDNESLERLDNIGDL